MKPVRGRHVPPSVAETAFNCPHCGALAKQFWHSTYVIKLEKDAAPEVVTWTSDDEKRIASIKEKEIQDAIRAYRKRKASGVAFIDPETKYRSTDLCLENVSVSQCYNCEGVTLWLYDNIIWPSAGEGPPANPDLPEDLRRDYDEASAILNLSPRGAAALLRLVIQKLCEHVGGKGKDLNANIAELAKRDLAPSIVQALDAVRVIGNNAVHPLQMDLKDDRATAETLFDLVNIIVDNLISRPNQISAVYAKLPTGALEAIEKRDGKKNDGDGPA